MAKRVRGGRTTHRPGGQGPNRNRKTGTTSAMEDEFAPAVLEPDIDGAVEAVAGEYTELAIEEPARTLAPTKRRRSRRSARAQAESLEGRAAAENVYVRDDLRRIGIISTVLVGGLAVAWVLLVVLDLFDLY